MLTLYRRGASKGWSLYEYESLDNLVISELIYIVYSVLFK